MTPAPTDLATRCAALLTDVRDRTPGAWERMLEAFGSLVLSEAHAAGLDGEDAEDVYQATWMALHRSIPRIRQPGALAAWIATTARREAWAVARKRARNTEDDELADGAGGADPAERALEVERGQLVQRGLGALDARCRELLERLFYAEEGPRYHDVAAAMGMKMGSVGPTRIRCLAKLAAWLEEHGLA